MAEQAVIIRFDYKADSLDPLSDLEEQITTAIESACVGEVDGHEIAMDLSKGSLYLYGPDADALYEVVLPILEDATCLQETEATLRYGPPEDGVRERLVKIQR